MFSGKVYNVDNTKINTEIGIVGLRAGLGFGISGSGGFIVVFNAHSLKDISETHFVDIELNADFLVDIVPESVLIKLGISVNELNDIKKVSRFMKMMPDTEVTVSNSVLASIGVMKHKLNLQDGRPKAICITFDYGLQLFAGMSGNQLYVDNPSFQ